MSKWRSGLRMSTLILQTRGVDMCELLGISSKVPYDFRAELKNFFKHCNENPHGWGIMYKKDGERKIVKEPVSADSSTKLPRLVSQLDSQNVLIAHIRYATVGAKNNENTHPFERYDDSGRRWTLIHNGTIFSGNVLTKYKQTQKGTTDSERILLYLIEQINQKIREKNEQDLDAEERFSVLNQVVCDITHRNKVNLMIYDGEYLYAHKNMKDTLSFKRTEDGIVLATKPIDDGNWIPLPMTTLLSFKDGKLIREGTNHGNVFVSYKESMNIFDGMNI